MVDAIMKKVDYISDAIVKLQLVRQNWSGKVIKDTEVFITYGEIVQYKSDLTDLHKDFYDQKTASTDPIHLATFETVFNSIKLLQVDVGEIKRKREDAAAVRTKSNPFKLEKIKLPPFSGNFSDWQDFEDLFISAVESNHNLNDSEKMVYLKSSLTGEAASIVTSFSTASTSFASAWALVQKRYSNQREIVFSHIRKFDELKSVQESSSGLRKLTDTINECVRSLKALKVQVEHWDIILIYYSLKKMDKETKKEWLLTQGNTLPKLVDFIDFLEKRATALAESSSKSKSYAKGHSTEKSTHHVSSSSSSKSFNLKCLKCGNQHHLHQCKDFASLQPTERKKFVADNRLCFNCLFHGHSVTNCKISSTCKKCQRRHHTLLHAENSGSKDKKEPSASELSSQDTSSLSLSSQVPGNSSQNSDQTGIGFVINSAGQKQACRIFFDPGSEVHFISENCMDRLGLPRRKSCVKIGGIAGAEAGTANGTANLKIFSKYRDQHVNLNALVMPKITKCMPKIQCKSNFKHLEGLQLADPSYSSPGAVDILIGAPLTGKIKLPGFIVGPPGEPDAQNTIFGWVISGEISSSTRSAHSSSFHVSTYHSHCSVHDPCLESALQRFWETEEISSASDSHSLEEDEAEEYFKSTVKQESSGRYSVRLPFKSTFQSLGESRSKAVRRLASIEKSFNKNPELMTSYFQQFHEFIENGLIEEVPSAEINSPNSYYMPHHIVSKLESATTKYRIVFDASCKSSNNLSLNDILLTGPKVQSDLVQLLIHFRTHKVAMSADIVKFFNQFIVREPDTNYQRLVFRSASNQQVKDYKMLRVCFGITTAPYLASRCLLQLAQDYQSTHPIASSIVKSSFLVDNLLTGASTIEEALIIQNEVIDLLSKANLELRKWASNEIEVLSPIPIDHRESVSTCEINEGMTVNSNTIGLLWNPITDEFSIKVKDIDIKSFSTKRQVISAIARSFDPLGWLSPVVIRLKCLLQSIWKEKLDWDTPLPAHLYQQWYYYCSDWSSLKNFIIPRCITNSSSPNSNYELHGFSDASILAYAACIYLKNGNSTSLICAKTKVAPVKGDTIPRLELCGAWLLAKLVKSVISSLSLNISAIYCWTDSNIVLSWLNSSEKLPVFIHNRVRNISQLVPEAKWHHVRGTDNPADFASRGMTSSNFLNCKEWLHGPSWLSSSVIPKSVSTHAAQASSSQQPSSFFQDQLYNFIMNTSDYVKMRRYLAYWVRFVNNSNKKNQSSFGQLKIKELKSAVHLLVLCVQQHIFKEEISRISYQQQPKNSLKFLSLFLDDHGILRVGGRLRNSNYSYDKRHPMLLPKSHHLTTTIIRFFHETYSHAGPRLLLSLLREKFWIPRGPQQCSRIVRACVTCFKANPRPSVQLMGQLPTSRVMPSRPFSNVGVDYAGPFYLCVTPGRKPRIIKSYVCVFVCMAVKAVHLELAGDLSTAAFIGAFKRFIARRGLCTNIYCDGGKNFEGAKNEIEAIQNFIKSSTHQQSVSQYFMSQEIHYHFNPPYGPHHGGIYEAAVKSMKFHLNRIVMDRKLSIEEFNTVLCQIEAALNSRPLTPLSSNPDDFSVLTPGHFLTGGPLLAEPQENLHDVNMRRLDRWQLVQQISQHFFRRWSKEYIQSLQQKPKWFETQPNLGIGSLVMVLNDESQLGPQQWKLGRIVAVYPGKDKLVRVCDVKMQVVNKKGEIKTTTYRRPITKLSPLPV